MADREFVGKEWFRFLRRRRVKRCLRIKGSARVDGDRLDEVYANLAPGQTEAMLGTEAVYGCRMQIGVTRSPTGDLVCLATDLHAQDACVTYRFRWSIESTFSKVESRGFDLERTGITLSDRPLRLFGLVTLAWVWCLRVGIDAAAQRLIPIKGHGRRARSLVTYG